MKKRITRMLAFLTTCALLCTSLCGCDAIDELRAGNATVLDERSIEWNSAVYKRLDALKSQKVEVGGIDLDRSVYINTDNVPALLLSMFCAEYHPTDNNVFLCGVKYDLWTDDVKPIGSEDGYQTTYYCREDRYNEVVRQLRDGLELTGYLYEYYEYETSEDGIHHLTEEQIAALEDVITPAYRWGTEVYDYDVSANVYACNDDGLLDTTKSYYVLKDGDTYFVEYYPEVTAGDYLWTDDPAEYYRVPNELKSVFDQMMRKAIESESYWRDWNEEWENTVTFLPENTEAA